jgi:DNA-binding YbaB/EbfC family protein
MMKGNLAQLMQQAQKMQADFKQAQEDLAKLEVQGEAGAGMVKVTLSGRHEVKAIHIDDEVMGDREMLEDLLVAAFNDAVNRLQALSQDKLAGLTGGLSLPPGFTLP